MPRLSAAPHLLAWLAVAGASVATAFALPATAQAASWSVISADKEAEVSGQGGAAAQRPLGAFSKLRIEGSIDVDAHPGSHPGATVHASAKLEPLIETVVEGDTLIVRLKHGVSVINFSWHDDGPKVDVEFTQLTATQQHGSGDLHVVGLSAPKLESQIAGSGDLTVENAQLGSFAVKIAGSGDVKIDGKADEARFSVAGSGDVEADRLVARRVAVEISGSGDAHVNATDALDARVAGSGDVTYRGNPHDITRKVAGSGSIEAEH